MAILCVITMGGCWHGQWAPEKVVELEWGKAENQILRRWFPAQDRWDYALQFAVSVDGMLAVGDAEGWIKFFDRDGRLVKKIASGRGWRQSFCFDYEGRFYFFDERQDKSGCIMRLGGDGQLEEFFFLSPEARGPLQRVVHVEASRDTLFVLARAKNMDFTPLFQVALSGSPGELTGVVEGKAGAISEAETVARTRGRLSVAVDVTSEELAQPFGVDEAGNKYVACDIDEDWRVGRVRVLAKDGGLARTWRGPGPVLYRDNYYLPLRLGQDDRLYAVQDPNSEVFALWCFPEP